MPHLFQAMTELDLERAKSEVILSLIPLLIFILFVLYAFCRHGVFSICNPLKSCPHRGDEIRAGAGGSSQETAGELSEDKSLFPLSPKQLLDYKRSSDGQKSAMVLASDNTDIQGAVGNDDDDDVDDDVLLNNMITTIQEDLDGEGQEVLNTVSQESSSKSNRAIGKMVFC